MHCLWSFIVQLLLYWNLATSQVRSSIIGNGLSTGYVNLLPTLADQPDSNLLTPSASDLSSSATKITGLHVTNFFDKTNIVCSDLTTNIANIVCSELTTNTANMVMSSSSSDIFKDISSQKVQKPSSTFESQRFEAVSSDIRNKPISLTVFSTVQNLLSASFESSLLIFSDTIAAEPSKMSTEPIGTEMNSVLATIEPNRSIVSSSGELGLANIEPSRAVVFSSSELGLATKEPSRAVVSYSSELGLATTEPSRAVVSSSSELGLATIEPSRAIVSSSGELGLATTEPSRAVVFSSSELGLATIEPSRAIVSSSNELGQATFEPSRAVVSSSGELGLATKEPSRAIVSSSSELELATIEPSRAIVSSSNELGQATFEPSRAVVSSSGELGLATKEPSRAIVSSSGELELATIEPSRAVVSSSRELKNTIYETSTFTVQSSGEDVLARTSIEPTLTSVSSSRKTDTPSMTLAEAFSVLSTFTSYTLDSQNRVLQDSLTLYETSLSNRFAEKTISTYSASFFHETIMSLFSTIKNTILVSAEPPLFEKKSASTALVEKAPSISETSADLVESVYFSVASTKIGVLDTFGTSISQDTANSVHSLLDMETSEVHGISTETVRPIEIHSSSVQSQALQSIPFSNVSEANSHAGLPSVTHPITERTGHSELIDLLTSITMPSVNSYILSYSQVWPLSTVEFPKHSDGFNLETATNILTTVQSPSLEKVYSNFIANDSAVLNLTSIGTILVGSSFQTSAIPVVNTSSAIIITSSFKDVSSMNEISTGYSTVSSLRTAISEIKLDYSSLESSDLSYLDTIGIKTKPLTASILSSFVPLPKNVSSPVSTVLISDVMVITAFPSSTFSLLMANTTYSAYKSTPSTLLTTVNTTNADDMTISLHPTEVLYSSLSSVLMPSDTVERTTFLLSSEIVQPSSTMVLSSSPTNSNFASVLSTNDTSVLLSTIFSTLESTLMSNSTFIITSAVTMTTSHTIFPETTLNIHTIMSEITPSALLANSDNNNKSELTPSSVSGNSNTKYISENTIITHIVPSSVVTETGTLITTNAEDKTVSLYSSTLLFSSLSSVLSPTNTVEGTTFLLSSEMILSSTKTNISFVSVLNTNDTPVLLSTMFTTLESTSVSNSTFNLTPAVTMTTIHTTFPEPISIIHTIMSEITHSAVLGNSETNNKSELIPSSVSDNTNTKYISENTIITHIVPSSVITKTGTLFTTKDKTVSLHSSTILFSSLSSVLSPTNTVEGTTFLLPSEMILSSTKTNSSFVSVLNTNYTPVLLSTMLSTLGITTMSNSTFIISSSFITETGTLITTKAEDKTVSLHSSTILFSSLSSVLIPTNTFKEATFLLPSEMIHPSTTILVFSSSNNSSFVSVLNTSYKLVLQSTVLFTLGSTALPNSSFIVMSSFITETGTLFTNNAEDKTVSLHSSTILFASLSSVLILTNKVEGTTFLLESEMILSSTKTNSSFVSVLNTNYTPVLLSTMFTTLGSTSVSNSTFNLTPAVTMTTIHTTFAEPASSIHTTMSEITHTAVLGNSDTNNKSELTPSSVSDNTNTKYISENTIITHIVPSSVIIGTLITTKAEDQTVSLHSSAILFTSLSSVLSPTDTVEGTTFLLSSEMILSSTKTNSSFVSVLNTNDTPVLLSTMFSTLESNSMRSSSFIETSAVITETGTLFTTNAEYKTVSLYSSTILFASLSSVSSPTNPVEGTTFILSSEMILSSTKNISFMSVLNTSDTPVLFSTLFSNLESTTMQNAIFNLTPAVTMTTIHTTFPEPTSSIHTIMSEITHSAVLGNSDTNNKSELTPSSVSDNTNTKYISENTIITHIVPSSAITETGTLFTTNAEDKTESLHSSTLLFSSFSSVLSPTNTVEGTTFILPSEMILSSTKNNSSFVSLLNTNYTPVLLSTIFSTLGSTTMSNSTFIITSSFITETGILITSKAEDKTVSLHSSTILFSSLSSVLIPTNTFKEATFLLPSEMIHPSTTILVFSSSNNSSFVSVLNTSYKLVLQSTVLSTLGSTALPNSSFIVTSSFITETGTLFTTNAEDKTVSLHSSTILFASLSSVLILTNKVEGTTFLLESEMILSSTKTNISFVSVLNTNDTPVLLSTVFSTLESTTMRSSSFIETSAVITETGTLFTTNAEYKTVSLHSSTILVASLSSVSSPTNPVEGTTFLLESEMILSSTKNISFMSVLNTSDTPVLLSTLFSNLESTTMQNATFNLTPAVTMTTIHTTFPEPASSIHTIMSEITHSAMLGNSDTNNKSELIPSSVSDNTNTKYISENTIITHIVPSSVITETGTLFTTNAEDKTVSLHSSTLLFSSLSSVLSPTNKVEGTMFLLSSEMILSSTKNNSSFVSVLNTNYTPVLLSTMLSTLESTTMYNSSFIITSSFITETGTLITTKAEDKTVSLHSSTILFASLSSVLILTNKVEGTTFLLESEMILSSTKTNISFVSVLNTNDTPGLLSTMFSTLESTTMYNSSFNLTPAVTMTTIHTTFPEPASNIHTTRSEITHSAVLGNSDTNNKSKLIPSSVSDNTNTKYISENTIITHIVPSSVITETGTLFTTNIEDKTESLHSSTILFSSLSSVLSPTKPVEGTTFILSSEMILSSTKNNSSFVSVLNTNYTPLLSSTIFSALGITTMSNSTFIITSSFITETGILIASKTEDKTVSLHSSTILFSSLSSVLSPTNKVEGTTFLLSSEMILSSTKTNSSFVSVLNTNYTPVLLSTIFSTFNLTPAVTMTTIHTTFPEPTMSFGTILSVIPPSNVSGNTSTKNMSEHTVITPIVHSPVIIETWTGTRFLNSTLIAGLSTIGQMSTPSTMTTVTTATGHSPIMNVTSSVSIGTIMPSSVPETSTGFTNTTRLLTSAWSSLPQTSFLHMTDTEIFQNSSVTPALTSSIVNITPSFIASSALSSSLNVTLISTSLYTTAGITVTPTSVLMTQLITLISDTVTPEIFSTSAFNNITLNVSDETTTLTTAVVFSNVTEVMFSNVTEAVFSNMTEVVSTNFSVTSTLAVSSFSMSIYNVSATKMPTLSTSTTAATTILSSLATSSAVLTTTVKPSTSTATIQPSKAPWNITEAGENYWVVTVLKVSKTKNISSPTFRSSIEAGLAEAYLQAYTRKEYIRLGVFDPLKKRRRRRKKRYIKAEDTAVHVQRISQDAGTSAVSVAYSVENNGSVVPAVDAVNTLALMDIQELAIILKEVVSTKAETYIKFISPGSGTADAGGMAVWMIASIAGGVAALIIIVFVVACCCFKCCHQQQKTDIKGQPQLVGLKTPLEEESEFVVTCADPEYLKEQPQQGSKASLLSQKSRKSQRYEVTQPRVQNKTPVKKRDLTRSKTSSIFNSRSEDSMDKEPVEGKPSRRKNNRLKESGLLNDQTPGPEDSPMLFRNMLDEDEELKKKAEMERKLNKERIKERIKDRRRKEKNQGLANDSLREEIERILEAPAENGLPHVFVDSSREKKKKEKELGQSNEGFAMEEETLEEARKRMHKLLDETFSLVSPEASSLELRKAVRSLSPSSARNDKVKEELSDDDTAHTPMYVTPVTYSKPTLETWSPYRASDQVALISMPKSQQTTIKSATTQPQTKPLRRPVALFPEPSTVASQERKYTTSPPKPIVITSRELLKPSTLDEQKPVSALTLITGVSKGLKNPSLGKLSKTHIDENDTNLSQSDHLMTNENAGSFEMKMLNNSQGKRRRHKRHGHEPRNCDEIDIITNNLKTGESTADYIRSIRKEIQHKPDRMDPQRKLRTSMTDVV